MKTSKNVYFFSRNSLLFNDNKRTRKKNKILLEDAIVHSSPQYCNHSFELLIFYIKSNKFQIKISFLVGLLFILLYKIIFDCF